MRILSVLVLTAGCVSATFHSQTGVTPPAVTDRAIVVAGADALGGQAEHLGTVDVAGPATDRQADLADKAATLAALRGGTHIVVREAGDATSTWTVPATETRTCTRDGDTQTCETSYQPESTASSSTPYATYDVYRVEPSAWVGLPADEQPEAIAPSRLEPVGADGAGTTIGWFSRAYPGPASGTNGNVFPTNYTADPSHANGLWISGSRTHGSTVVAGDLGLGGGSFSGMAQSESGGQWVPYTTTYGGLALDIRVGKQLAWRNVALAGGVGVGGAVWGGPSSYDMSTFVFVQPPDEPVVDLYLPLWASLTIKTSCDWGVQAMASYDVRPLDTTTSSPSFGVGLEWQPASACR
jgi:hypothetical protein